MWRHPGNSERGDDERLKRVARYLHAHPDGMQWYPVQEDTNTVVLTTDADWATCPESHRSNSGGTLQLGMISSPRGVVFNHALHQVLTEQRCMLECAEFGKHWVRSHDA